MTAPPTQSAGVMSPSKIGGIVLPPDATLLVEARIKASEPTLQLKAVTNIILQDPILTLDVLHFANSLLFAGAAITDVEAALSRLGTKQLIELLVKVNAKGRIDPELLEVFEVLRYNCRRISLISLIIATVLRPTLANSARVSGLFADIGHMLAVVVHGKKYCDLAKSTKRKLLGFRVQKDLNFDLVAMQAAYLTTRGIPKTLLLPYDLSVEAKGPAETDLRFLVLSALEIVEAYDNQKFSTYNPDKPLPSQSNLRLLKATPVLMDRIYKACGAYLKSVEAEQAPEGASMLISSQEDLQGQEAPPPASTVENIGVPAYQNLSVQPKNRDALQGFMSLCEEEKEPEELKRKAIDFLTTRRLFNRMAIVRVSPKSDDAEVVIAQGLDKKAGDKISVKDNLSPLRAFRMQILSTSVKSPQNAQAPFGNSAFAIGPLETLPSGDHLVMYGDLHGNPVLTLEARRIFRLSMGLLVQALRTLQSTPAPAPKK